MKSIKLLDCTLRDGAYVNNADFGESCIHGIVRKLCEAHADVIECGWFKDLERKKGSSWFHDAGELVPYLKKEEGILYTVMIDWDRYNTDFLSPCDGTSVDGVRIVFPHGRHKEGIEVGRKIREKGYQVLFQAANTLAYTDEDLHELARDMNEFKPVSLSVVDTFGAMFFGDLEHIVSILDRELDPSISIGFHAHNNQQLAFALCVHFIGLMKNSDRDVMIDGTLSGMGRGAGNAPTELLVNYLNRFCHGNYDMNAVMDAIDMYMKPLSEHYEWGYSTPYFIAGMYQCHVNNIAYLLNNHRSNSRDMRNIIDSLSQEERRKYDYDLLEQKYVENQSRIVDDAAAEERLLTLLKGRKILLLAPGKSLDTEAEKINAYIRENNPVVIAVNALPKNYRPDLVFFSNSLRYDYAKLSHADRIGKLPRILLSNVPQEGSDLELVINFNRVIKRGWPHFDNSMMLCLRLMNLLRIPEVAIAGFDGFKDEYRESYSDAKLPSLNTTGDWVGLNREIREMFQDFRSQTAHSMKIEFVTKSYFE